MSDLLAPLTAINGKAVFKGDTLYSAFHGQSDMVQSVWADSDRDVYVQFENIGQAKLTSCIPVERG